MSRLGPSLLHWRNRQQGRGRSSPGYGGQLLATAAAVRRCLCLVFPLLSWLKTLPFRADLQDDEESATALAEAAFLSNQSNPSLVQRERLVISFHRLCLLRVCVHRLFALCVLSPPFTASHGAPTDDGAAEGGGPAGRHPALPGQARRHPRRLAPSTHTHTAVCTDAWDCPPQRSWPEAPRRVVAPRLPQHLICVLARITSLVVWTSRAAAGGREGTAFPGASAASRQKTDAFHRAAFRLRCHLWPRVSSQLQQGFSTGVAAVSHGSCSRGSPQGLQL